MNTDYGPKEIVIKSKMGKMIILVDEQDIGIDNNASEYMEMGLTIDIRDIQKTITNYCKNCGSVYIEDGAANFCMECR